jgi:NDP-sugar pyrophosphorylase family protein
LYLDLVHLEDLVADFEAETSIGENFSFAVILAGGEGSRLRPLTAVTPKPMIKVGDFPLIEHQIRNLSSLGIKQIFISINYLGGVIENYFGNGDRFGVVIEYLREKEKRGTAGSLSLLPYAPSSAFLVINGDIFTASNFNALFRYHMAANSQITIGTVDYQIEIPFGVITMERENVIKILEKPSQRYMCSA